MEDRKPYFEKLGERCEGAETNLCVGLDPDGARIPKHLGSGPDGVFKFCAEIIEATSDFAAAFKPNIAFFEALGVEGWHVLAEALALIKPEIPVILDAKRGDIGSTAEQYAKSIFERLKADAVTVNPLMGSDSVGPWLKYKNRGIYLLTLTSNPGAEDFEMPNDLYLRIAAKAAEWNTAGNIGMVVGATKPEYMQSILETAPDLPILLPGLGTQGGDLEAVMAAAKGKRRHHLLFNVSRSVLYASDGEDFGHAARKAASHYRDIINRAWEAHLS